jgi:calcineurin-like phosphoesterase family protein
LHISFIVLGSAIIILVLSAIWNSNNADTFALIKKPSGYDFSFAASGDWGCGLNAFYTVLEILQKNPQIVISTGDLSYSKSANCWFDLVAPLEKDQKIRIAFGDHDLDFNRTKYNQYLTHFNLVKPFYSFDYGNVHFLAMATGRDGIVPYGNKSAQYEFVVQDLKNAHNNESIEWIIVYGYMPLYSSPTRHPGDPKVTKIYHPIFDKYGVDLVIQGHNHNYQRTYPLAYNMANDSNPIITSTSKREYESEPGGPIFVTVGTAGQNMYNFTGQEPYIIEQFLRHGFLNVDIIGNGSKLNATFIENRSGKVQDQFSIVKHYR